MQNLLIEVGDLSRRNDELMTAKDSDLVVIRDLDNQLKEYKRKYEQAKTELRSVKGTSTLSALLCQSVQGRLQLHLNCSCKHQRSTNLKTNYLSALMVVFSIYMSPLSSLLLTAF